MRGQNPYRSGVGAFGPVSTVAALSQARLGDIEEMHDESFDDWADEIYYGEEQ